MVASGVWAEAIPLEKAYSLLSVGTSSVTQKSELERIGYLGSLPTSYKCNPIGAHFELHIELQEERLALWKVYKRISGLR
jgi:hypothetical protein